MQYAHRRGGITHTCTHMSVCIHALKYEHISRFICLCEQLLHSLYKVQRFLKYSPGVNWVPSEDFQTLNSPTLAENRPQGTKIILTFLFFLTKLELGLGGKYRLHEKLRILGL